ncbi:MAG: cytochrome C peroxidase [Sphingomonadales bacterium]|nr:cytochrome C peroxidase [Sphingomonadales bacterium]
MCHLESNAFASTQSSKAVGMEGQTLRRNAPSVLNVVYQKSLLHDGREHDLALQVWLPLLAADEMANPSIGHVLRRLQSLPGYLDAFSKVYPDRGIAVDTIGDAIAAYESTLLSANSRFDRWLFGRDKGALTAAEQEGLALFTGKAGCASCHRIELDHALFTDHEFHNTGIGYRATMQRDRQYSVQLAPGESTVVRDAELRSVAEGVKGDIGRFEITLKSEHRWAYKTPSLRNVTLTPPYMHDGSIATLAEVVRYYNEAVLLTMVWIRVLRKLGLTPQEQDNLLAFLGALVGE